jgi:hypothetical protein
MEFSSKLVFKDKISFIGLTPKLSFGLFTLKAWEMGKKEIFEESDINKN